MREGKSIFADIDWFLVLIYIILMLLGWFNIYASAYNEDHKSIFDITQNYGKQIIWIFTAIILALIILITDARFFPAFSYPVYGLMMLLLIAVLLFGREVAGSKSWFEIGSFRIQPSEFAKFATAMAAAKFLSIINIKMKDMKTRLITVFIVCFPLALILLQGDAGSSLTYVAFIFVLYREGLSGNFLLIGLLAAILFIVTLLLQNTSFDTAFDMKMSGKNLIVTILTVIGLFLLFVFKKSPNQRGSSNYNKQMMVLILTSLLLSCAFIYSVDYAFDNVLSSHQRDRINELLGIQNDPKGTGYNVMQSKIAIGSGGFLGKGFLQGTQTKFAFVPEQSTDFIFCTVGEEWGFVGSFLIIILFLALFLRIIIVAERQRSVYSRVYGYGVVSVLFLHFAINIGMTIGLAPVIGIPLPFLSYGGSSLWGFTILLFILIKLDAYRLQSFR